jgi:hypothetical protein
LAEERDIERLAELVRDFPERCEEKRSAWKERLRAYAERNQRVVLWGAGSKAVAFLSTLGEESTIGYGVDINPYRQGPYLPGTGLPIVAPEVLADDGPDAVIVMNPIYRDEIARELSRMGIAPDILTL